MQTLASIEAEHFDVHLVLNYHPKYKKPNILYLDITDLSFDCIEGQDNCDNCPIADHCEISNAGDNDEDKQYQEGIHTRDFIQKYFPDHLDKHPEYFV